jgi:hypothetical protein
MSDLGTSGLLALLPFGLIIGAGILTAILTAGGKMTPEDYQQIVTYVVVILLIVAVVSMLTCALCYRIRPEEGFVAGVIDISGAMNKQEDDEVQDLWTAVGKTEEAICKLIKQTDTYIQNGLGPKDKDVPSLVSAAQQEARADAGGPITDCSANWPTTIADVSSQTLDMTMSQLDDRINRMETTLKGFSAPVLEKAYKSTVECSTESFGDYAPFESFVATSLTALQDRLKAVQASINYQEKKLIGGMKQKMKDLQAGKASDCDKQRGAKTAMGSGSK